MPIWARQRIPPRVKATAGPGFVFLWCAGRGRSTIHTARAAGGRAAARRRRHDPHHFAPSAGRPHWGRQCHRDGPAATEPLLRNSLSPRRRARPAELPALRRPPGRRPGPERTRRQVGVKCLLSATHEGLQNLLVLLLLLLQLVIIIMIRG